MSFSFAKTYMDCEQQTGTVFYFFLYHNYESIWTKNQNSSIDESYTACPNNLVPKAYVQTLSSPAPSEKIGTERLKIEPVYRPPPRLPASLRKTWGYLRPSLPDFFWGEGSVRTQALFQALRGKETRLINPDLEVDTLQKNTASP